jgi:hypothetical protein
MTFDPTDDAAAPNIPPEEQELVRTIMKRFTKLKKNREQYDRNWMHYYRMWRGDQWANTLMPRHRQKEVVNMIWSTVQSSQSQQLDVRPRIAYVPREPTDQPFAEVLNDVVNADWERHNWLVPLTELVIDAYIYGIGYGGIGYDPDADYGLGTATFESEDPFYLYPDCQAIEINGRRSKIFIKAEPVDTQLLKGEYPEKRDFIKPDVQDLLKSSKASINDFTYKTSNADRDMPDTTVLRGSEVSPDKTLVITAYMKPDDTEEVEEEDEGTKKKVVKKVYPLGRVVKIASGVVLEEEGKLPFANGLFPYVKYLNYILPREFFGVSEVEQLESPQRVFNKLINASLEILNLMGNPVWIVGTDSGVNPRSLVNKTGLVVEKEPNSEVRREIGVQLSGTALSFIDRMEGWFNQVAGSQDVSRGETPGSVTAASAIEALQEAARTRVKQKQRNLDATIRDWGQQYADIVLEKYNKPRVFRVTNDQEGTRFFRFSTEKVVDQDTGRELVKATVRDFVENPDGQLVLNPEVKEMLIADRFDVTVSTVSGLPFAQAKKEERTFALFDRGIVDEQEVLEQLDYPNKDAVLARLEERKAREAEAAAAQGAV